jgi:hypothetical protein
MWSVWVREHLDAPRESHRVVMSVIISVVISVVIRVRVGELGCRAATVSLNALHLHLSPSISTEISISISISISTGLLAAEQRACRGRKELVALPHLGRCGGGRRHHLTEDDRRAGLVSEGGARGGEVRSK